MSYRIVIYVNSPNGDGHNVRALKLAQALKEAGAEVVILTSPKEENRFNFQNIETHIIRPAYSIAGDIDPDSVLGDLGDPKDAMRAERSRRNSIAAFCKKFGPHMALFEGCPLGRHKTNLSVATLLAIRENHNPDLKIVSFVRDIIGFYDAQRMEDGSLRPRKMTRADGAHDYRITEIYEALDKNFDAVLVHGDPNLMEIDFDFGGLEHKLHYTGYVANTPNGVRNPDIPEEQREVLISVGAGDYGRAILYLALAARQHCPDLAGSPWHFILGQRSNDLQGFFAAVVALGLTVDCPELGITHRHPQVRVSLYRKDYRDMMADSRAAIIGGGCNSVIEAVKMGARAVALPAFERRNGVVVSHPEQKLRIDLMASAGRLATIGMDKLDDARFLAKSLEAVAQRPFGIDSGINTDGAKTGAQLLMRMCENDPALIPVRGHRAAFRRPAFQQAAMA